MFLENRVGRHLHVIFESLPNPLEQLVFLESLRDRYTRLYVHEAWASVSSPDEVHAALREIHLRIFKSLAGLSLIELSKKLRGYFESLAQPEQRTAVLWMETKPYLEMIPDGCSPLWRKFFISQIRCALELLIVAPDWAALGEPAVTVAAPVSLPVSVSAESVPPFVPPTVPSQSDWVN